MSDDYSFLTGGLGDTNGDGKVNFVEYDNCIDDFNRIYGKDRYTSSSNKTNSKSLIDLNNKEPIPNSLWVIMFLSCVMPIFSIYINNGEQYMNIVFPLTLIALICFFIAFANRLKNDKLDSKSEQSVDSESKKARKKLLLVFIGIAALILSLIAVPTGKLHITYYRAEKLIEKENFSEAYNLLEDIEFEEYKDTKSLMVLCDAHKYNDKGNFMYACFILRDVVFKYQSKEQINTINAFKTLLEEKWDNEINERVRAEMAKPKYDQYKYENDDSQNSEYAFTPRPSTDNNNDPYNATDYAHPEDFYYDHNDDFFDYDDAEAYYNEHDD